MADNFIPFTNLNRALPSSTPFVGPEALERQLGQRFKARLGANESSFGPSPKAMEAMRSALVETSWYGDPENFDLRKKLAARHGVEREEIVVAAGIDSLLGLIVRMVVSPGTPVVTSLGAYPTFNYQVAGAGGVLKTAPYKGDHEDPDALLALARQSEAPLIFFANPDNPMGSWHPSETVQGLINAVPTGTLLILDEAYADFAPTAAIPEMQTHNPRVIRVRTFSKAYGLAGARIGYAIGHRDLTTGINKIRTQFEVTRLAQAAALASLDDSDYVASVLAEVDAGKREYGAIAEKHGYNALPSATNFVAIDMGDVDTAKGMVSELAKRGVFIRMPGAPPLDRCIRVTVGNEKERALFAEAFSDCLPL